MEKKFLPLRQQTNTKTNTMKKYTITNDNFSQHADIATAEQIVSMIIENNSDWGTDYCKDDFYITDSKIYLRTEVIADAVKVKITATAPTAYQFNSLLAFGMEYRKNANGSFTASQEFDTFEEAIEHLVERAESFYDEDEDALNYWLNEIQTRHCLTLDAVTAGIDEA